METWLKYHSNATIEAVEKGIQSKGFKKGLKFENYSGFTFLDSYWIAGVDENKNDEKKKIKSKVEIKMKSKMKTMKIKI